jgi:hypothetical protein
MPKSSPKLWRAIFLLYIAVLPFASLPFINRTGSQLQLGDFVFLLCAAAWIVQERSAIFRWSRFHSCLAAYAIAVTISASISEAFAFSAVKAVGKFYLIAIAILTWHFVDSLDSLRRLTLAWLAATAVVVSAGVLGTAAFYAGLRNPDVNLVLHHTFGSLPSGNYPRMEGFFEFPAILCNYLGISWMLALMAATAGWIRWRTAAIIGLPLFTVDALTLTPGLGGIFLSTGVFIYVWLKGLSKLTRIAALAGGILIAAVSFASAAVALFRFTDGRMTIPLLAGDIFPSHRSTAWATAFETFTQHPLFGRGVGMPVSNAVVTDPAGGVHLLADAHNTYLSVLGETGVIGFAAFSLIVFAAATALRRARTAYANHAIPLCLLLALADAFFFQSLVGSFEDSRHVWVLFGTAAAAGRISESEKVRSTESM